MLATPPRDSGRPRHAAIELAALALFYAAAFVVLTYPRSLLFSTHFWADLGDGMENVWNLWWVRTAVLELGRSPWHTDYLHYPYGISLHAHALSAFNGFLAIPLSFILTPVQTYNAIVVFTFVACGITAFLLARSVTGNTLASIAAGWAFTFSGFHFAHTGAHLNVIALQWIPLVLLCWLRFLARPTAGVAIGAALALFGVLLCDYYFVAYTVLSAVLLTACEAWRRRDPFFLARAPYRRPLAIFAAAVALTSGILVAAIVRAYLESPFVGGHDPRRLSLDLLAPFIPGGDSRFAPRFAWFWATVGGNVNENSVYVGWAAVALIAIAWTARRSAGAAPSSTMLTASDSHEPGSTRRLGPWFVLLAVFFVAALGPQLRVFGWEVPGLLLPYGWLERTVPFVRLGGVPLRAFAMVTVAASVLVAAGIDRLVRSGPRDLAWAGVLAVVLAIETLPNVIPASEPPLRSVATLLATKPGHDAMIDVSDPPMPNGPALYFQTIHRKPMAFGHTSRRTAAVVAGERRLRDAIQARDHRALRCEYGFRYLVSDETLDLDPSAETVDLFEPGRRGRLHDLARRFPDCAPPARR